MVRKKQIYKYRCRYRYMKRETKYDKMLTFGQSGWNLYTNSLHYSCNFSINLKLFQNKVKKKIQKNKRKDTCLLFYSFLTKDAVVTCFVCLVGFIHLCRLISPVKADLSSGGKASFHKYSKLLQLINISRYFTSKHQ